MRLHFGPIPLNPLFQPAAAGWFALKEPNPWLFQLMALPVGIVAALLVLAGWSAMTHPALPTLASPVVPLELLAIFVALVPLHEGVHALSHPGWGHSSASILGFWPATLLFYAHYDEALSRNRFLFMLAAPFLILSIGPLLACGMLGRSHWLAVAFTAINALLACADLAGALLVISQVPSRATVRNLGYFTWWTAAARSEPESRTPLDTQGGAGGAA